VFFVWIRFTKDLPHYLSHLTSEPVIPFIVANPSIFYPQL
jgi:hypothetical protein